MADDFSFLTDSDDERAVQDVLSQALDHSVLEQIAAINCSSFSTSDNLPSDLENRFRKLKSLPTTAATAAAAAAVAGSRSPISKSKSFTPRSVDFERIPDLKKCSQKSSPVTDDPQQHSDGKRDEKKGTDPKSKSKSRTGSSGSRSDSWSVSSPESEPESESRSVSPARRGIGCLWCSPKKEKRRQGKENRLTSSSAWGSEYDVEFLKTFSVKEQKKIMRKAMKEEEKINREAEKIVKWAKQASSRMMDVSGVVDDDELTDHEK